MQGQATLILGIIVFTYIVFNKTREIGLLWLVLIF